MNYKVYEESVFFQDATESLISNRFEDIDFQLKHDKTAEIIFSDKYFNKPIESSNKHIDWEVVGEVLKEKYKYVAMERLNKDYNSVEEELQRIGYDGNIWSMLAFEDIKKLDISHFKFIIWKNKSDFNHDYDRNLRQYFDF